MWKIAAAGGEVRAKYMAVPLLAVAAMLAPAVAHADPLDDYVSRKGKEVCAALGRPRTRATFSDWNSPSRMTADSASRTL